MSEVHRTNNVLTMGVACLGAFMINLDSSIVTLALPRIQTDLHANLPDLQWTIDAYTLPFAVLLLTGGTLGDRFGRKRFSWSDLSSLRSAQCSAGLHRRSAGCSLVAWCRAWVQWRLRPTASRF